MPPVGKRIERCSQSPNALKRYVKRYVKKFNVKTLNPVCGVNGITYDNRAIAACFEQLGCRDCRGV